MSHRVALCRPGVAPAIGRCSNSGSRPDFLRLYQGLGVRAIAVVLVSTGGCG